MEQAGAQSYGYAVFLMNDKAVDYLTAGANVFRAPIAGVDIDDIAELFRGADSDWEQDRELLDDDLRDPWADR